ncbi:hypothetical protein [Flavobacterium terrae]|nr:hypothetical protein [Flavobacterium terrae]
MFGVIRFMYISFNEHLNSLIDNFLISPESVEKPHKIYEKAIDVFNQSSLIFFEVDKIMCFKIKNENIIPVNASLFIWNFTVDDDLISQIVNSPKESYFAFHSNLIINGISFPKNYLLTYRIADTIYCYFILPRKQNFIFDNELMPYFNELVAPFFSRTSKIFEAYSERKRLGIEAIVEMESKISYVQNAKSSMHFIRNKLGPLSNYLAMITDYEQSDSKANKSALKAIIDAERSKLSTSVDEILKRAHYILDRSNNPFLVNKLSDHSIKKLYSEVKRVWESYFNVFVPSLNWNVTRDDYVIKFNTIGLDFVLVNWINNMKKYGGGKQFVTLDEDSQFIILDFSNSIKDLIGATDAVHAFQSNDRIEILQRNTHGIVEIIDFLNQMNISYNAHIESNKLHLILKFIKHHNK